MPPTSPMTSSTSAFEDRYVKTNIRPDAPTYSSTYIASLRKQLTDLNQADWDTYSYAILVAISIGSHRGDFVPQLFEESIEKVKDEQELKQIFYQIRECIMIIWPFVGVLWTVPAGLGLVNVLQRHNLEYLGAQTFRTPFDADAHRVEGLEMIAKTYESVNNNEVRDMLAVGFPEMRSSMTSLIWGFNVAGAPRSGYLTAAQAELLLATSIIAGGATRQSRSHIKASIGMGNDVLAVKTVVRIAADFANWTGSPLPNALDVDQILSS